MKNKFDYFTITDTSLVKATKKQGTKRLVTVEKLFAQDKTRLSARDALNLITSKDLLWQRSLKNKKKNLLLIVSMH